MFVTGVITATLTYFLWPFPLGFKEFYPPLEAVLAAFLLGVGLARAFAAVIANRKKQNS